MTFLEKLTWAVLCLALFLAATLASGVFFHVCNPPPPQIILVPLQVAR